MRVTLLGSVSTEEIVTESCMNVEIELNYTVNKIHIKLNNYFI